MKTLAEFTKTTLIGGILVILPIYIAVLLLAKTVKGLLALLAPVTAQVPAAVEFRQIVAILLLVAICFVVGLIVHTGPGPPRQKRLRACGPGKASRLHLSARAGQTTKRPQRGAGPAAGAGRDRGRAGAGADRRGAGGRLLSVLVTSAPTPMAGSIYILARDRVRPVDIPFTKAIGVFSKWGTGAGEFVRAMNNASVAQPAGRPLPQLNS